MEMNNRLKQLRKALNITQQQFADRIKISYGYIANLELGDRPINDRIIKLICDEFGVNEKWLRDGEGSMFVEHDLEMLEILGEKLDSLSEFQINAIKLIINLTPGQLQLLNLIIKQLNNDK